MSQLNGFKRSAPAQSLMGFVPSLVLQNIIERNARPEDLPFQQQFQSVVMYANISGFTQLTEGMMEKGPEANEMIALMIDKYLEKLVSAIEWSGGDIFKIGGDSLIIIWPPPEKTGITLQQLCKRAVQSGLDIQTKLMNPQEIKHKYYISLRIGFGVGEVSIIYVGGVLKRCEYLPTGMPLIQAYHAESLCQRGGETIVSEDIHKLLGSSFTFNRIETDGRKTDFYQVLMPSGDKREQIIFDALLQKNSIHPSQLTLIKYHVLPYIPAALLPYIDIDEEKWSSELRFVSVVYIRLNVDLSNISIDNGLERVQKIVQTVQKAVYMYEGSINKILMNNRGTLIIAVFGLPPMTHQDDGVRAVMMAQMLQRELERQNVQSNFGIATGIVYSGILGVSGQRREYSILGDKVNLASKLMDYATFLKIKILCCEQTVLVASNKLQFKFLQSAVLKGFRDKKDIHVPISVDHVKYDPFPQIRIHLHQKQLDWIKEQQENEQRAGKNQSSEEIKSKLLDITGREDQIKDIQIKMDKFLKGKVKKGVYIIMGAYAVGKSQILKYILNKIEKRMNRAPFVQWKYDEKVSIFIAEVMPLDIAQKLNGLQKILREMFYKIAKRNNRNPDRQFFESLLKPDIFISKDYKTFLKIMGLKKFDKFKRFPPPPQEEDQDELKIQQRQFKQMIFTLLNHYFEITNKSPNQLEQSDSQDTPSEHTSYSASLIKPRSQISSMIAPVIFVLEDMQNFDSLTFYMLKSIIKNFNWIFMVGCLRDQDVEKPVILKNATPVIVNINKEAYIDGIQILENDDFDQTVIKNMVRNDSVDEFELLMKNILEIHNFQMDSIQRDDSQNKNQTLQPTAAQKQLKEQLDLKQIVLEQNTNKILQDQLLFSLNKWELIRRKFSLYCNYFFYLKTQGHPLLVIQLITTLQQTVIQQNSDQKTESKNQQTKNMLTIESHTARVSPELRKILEHEEMIAVQAPIASIQMNGPIIDRLNCLESLLMKVASVIGDIFDLQTLNRINPFKDAINYDTLSKVLRELDTKDFIQIMDIQDNNISYRFTHLNAREVIYQRMTYDQRVRLHKYVAEAIHTLPQAPDQDERKEELKLQFHWTQTENKEPGKHEYFDPNDVGTQSRRQSVQSRAKRSMMVKQIQQILAKNHNDPTVEIKIGILDKKSDSNITWANRFCVINSKSFTYYYSREDYKNSKETYLGAIMLKNIVNVFISNQELAGKDKKVFIMSVNGWLKKNKEMGRRMLFLLGKVSSFLLFKKNRISNSGRYRWSLQRLKLYMMILLKISVKYSSQQGIQTKLFSSDLQQYDPAISLQVTQINNKVSKLERSKINIPINFAAGSSNRASRSSRFLAKIQRSGTNTILDEYRDQMSQIQRQEVETLKKWIELFFFKSIHIFFAQVCEMSLQKNDKQYKKFGQTPKLFLGPNNKFIRVDRERISLKSDRKRQSRVESMEDLSSRFRVSINEYAKPQTYDAVAGDHLLKLSFKNHSNNPHHYQLKLNPIDEVEDQAEQGSLVRKNNHDIHSKSKIEESNFPTSESDILSYSQFLEDLNYQFLKK